MEKLTLSSPWITFTKEIKLLFRQDPDIRIIIDFDTNEIKLLVSKKNKAEALAKLLPVEKTFGNITVKITVVPPNDEPDTPIEWIKTAFEGNPVFDGAQSKESTIGSFNYAVFKKEVVQFYNDQLDDINGNKSMLYQEIAKDVLGTQDGVFYCTNVYETEQ